MTTDAEANKELITITEQKQLEVYHQIENWGCTLFLTGILLIAKQEMDWKFEYAEAWAGVRYWVSLAPAAVGLYGYVVLLAVNFRARRIRQRFFGVPDPKPRGTLGWLLALMPPLAGIAATLLIGEFSVPAILVLFAFTLITAGAYCLDHHPEVIKSMQE